MRLTVPKPKRQKRAPRPVIKPKQMVQSKIRVGKKEDSDSHLFI